MPTDTTGTLVGNDIAAQTDQVLGNLLRATELCGGGPADVVSVRAYLTDWDDYDAFNTAYAPWFPDRLPSRTWSVRRVWRWAHAWRSTGCAGAPTAGSDPAQREPALRSATAH